jgi:GT2 family glycosyltransferase
MDKVGMAEGLTKVTGNGERRPSRVAVLMTCYNRKALTLKALGAILPTQGHRSEIKAFLVDAGSPDGTAAAVKDQFPSVEIIPASSDVYWGTGTRRAWLAALEGDFDFFLWLNDDVELRPGVVDELLASYDENRSIHGDRVVVVGRLLAPSDGETSYGALKRIKGLSRLNFRPVGDDAETVADTMQGNCVLIPRRAADDVGIMSRVFSHSMGDIDYGLRCTEAGYKILQARQPVANLERHTPLYHGGSASLSWRGIKAVAFHPKGLPVLEFLWFCLRHGGVFGLANFILAYLRIFGPKRKVASA